MESPSKSTDKVGFQWISKMSLDNDSTFYSFNAKKDRQDFLVLFEPFISIDV